MADARAALAVAAARFAFSATPRLDAELLLAHALGIGRDALLLDLDRPVPTGFAELVRRREAQEPVAYITGTRGFWTIDLHIAPGVLVPRADSETLIEAAVAHFAGTPGPRTILDLGTGSGALLLAALDQWPSARGVGVDRSVDALAVAAINVERLGCRDRAHLVEGGWTAAAGRYDLVLCNPPYIEEDAPLPREVAGYEPAEALFAGADGLDAYRVLAPVIAARLAAGGVGCIEIGATQAAAAGALFGDAGLAVTVRRDLGGRDRCLIVVS